ncbi:peptidyl-prolyl cis-trans isomerase CYP21-4-like isoform X1 [Asparagus officinalis]|uniref:peptidyl-prolyl cis-trans isomerase CYP21-4-like isoform X1 n=1 Tax=Asparagus officinalis TaxID=4686 RepID=UPI00098E0470|nr:peptidyl-prolyl cis-trans isomerase CYP21-4-like isoform X1 [Asparagus officinalis]
MARIKPQALLMQSKKKKAPARISLTAIIACNLTVFLAVFSLYATYKYWYRRPSDKTEFYPNTFEVCMVFSLNITSFHFLVSLSCILFFSFSLLQDTEALGELKDLPSYAILNTAKGSVTAELYKDSSPEVVDKFLDLCQKGHFKGMPFHRVIKHYVIQGGDFPELGAAEDWTLKGKSHSELAKSSKHEAFMLGTTKAKSENKGFELFITTAPIPDLNDKIVVFGRVIKGEDVVQEIEEVDTDEHYRPKSPIGIIDIILKHEP